MTYLYFVLTYIVFFAFNLFSQPSLNWINRTGTNADSIFDSRVYFHPDHFYNPLTNYKYFPYSANTDEFELRRLKVHQEWYKRLFNNIWEIGFLLQMPIKAEGQTEINSIAIIGKYDFTNQKFPLKFQKSNVEYSLSDDEADLKKLYSHSKVSEPKYTDLGKIIFILQPVVITKSLIFLNVSNKYSESFKQAVINGSIGIELIIEFQPKPSFLTKVVEKEFFKQFKKESLTTINLKERFLKYYRNKPLELLHIVKLNYRILGFRIVDGDHLILFEDYDHSTRPVCWVQDSLITKENFIPIKEKRIGSSIRSRTAKSWIEDAIISSYKISQKPTLIGNKFRSWWDCDLYLKLRGLRMPSLIEVEEAINVYGSEIINYVKGINGNKYEIGQEITMSRGNYLSDGFIYHTAKENYTSMYGRNMGSTYSDGFWSSYESFFRGVIR